MRKTMILLPLLLLAMTAQSESVVRVVVNNGPASAFAADNVRKLVLLPSSVELINPDGTQLQSVPLANLLRVEFGEGTPYVPTGIEETPFPTNDNPSQATKFIRDGQLFILYNDKMYTITGARVQ